MRSCEAPGHQRRQSCRATFAVAVSSRARPQAGQQGEDGQQGGRRGGATLR
eukprot:CAMPEP_0206142558 /NCGR_PEP_ID=MMETSP1473-20131121/17382_1 /ASSEMBLY_ACC=CAM_ASM_001109 /TAXON_ID=1461547 /ORGANISM="Stichococcus sp, Strain RCC1054" /LENGTH=50 /DNA_ID=CAMNT_0053537603 /DNA_START=20 /DNA_END=168 /DNA_ORIENTATION=-